MVERSMGVPSVFLLTTCQLETDGTADLRKLVASVASAKRDGGIARLGHIVLLQGCGGADVLDSAGELPKWVDVLTVEERLSSPEARNLMIHHLLARDDFDAEAVIGFPDDDAWYPPGALACVAQQFQSSPELELLLSRYGPAPSVTACTGAFRPTLQQALSRSACAAVFIRGKLLVQLGGFHELLGLGTELKGGEDTEFVHRAFHRSNGRALCIPGYLVGHHTADASKKAQYYEGALAAILAHRRASPAARIALARKLMVGIWLVLRGRLPFSNYLRAFQKAMLHASAVRGGPSLRMITQRIDKAMLS